MYLGVASIKIVLSCLAVKFIAILVRTGSSKKFPVTIILFYLSDIEAGGSSRSLLITKYHLIIPLFVPFGV